MIAWLEDDAWSPFFPNAEVLLSRRELDAITDADAYRPEGSDALLALHAQGVVTAVEDRHEVTPEVTTTVTGAHSPGHQIIDIASRDAEATMIGHLALTPLHCVTRTDSSRHFDVPAAAAILEDLRDRRRLLIGPLWPAPGAARWTGTEMRAELTDAPL